MSSPLARRAFILGTLTLGLAVLIGAFGAHGLKTLVTAEKLVTFETGVRYQFYHGFGLMLAAFYCQLFPAARLSVTIHSFVVGILLFSFNCYFYSLSDMKVFALIVPVGGLLFILGWINFCYRVIKA